MHTANDKLDLQYLAHVGGMTAKHEFEASEDILSRTGLKLLIKGAPVSAAACERLLQHKLSKPLAACLAIVGGVQSQDLAALCKRLLTQHSLLRSICADSGCVLIASFWAELRLSSQVLTLLSIYADQHADRLPHAVGVAMLALGLARKLMPDDLEQQRLMAIAGLLHDVGELYIAPKILLREEPMNAEKWRHITSHPLIGHRVLSTLPGAGPVVAEAVLQHHERLDGFGYPRASSDKQVHLGGQILAAAEWLIALIESGASPTTRASVAAKLMPGEFSPQVVTVILAAARVSQEFSIREPLPVEQLTAQLRNIIRTLRSFHKSHEWWLERVGKAGPELRQLLHLGQQRMTRIQIAFSSSGLDTHSPEKMLQELTGELDGDALLELTALAREFGWRVQELKREVLLRAGSLCATDAAVVSGWLDRLVFSPLPRFHAVKARLQTA
jgi:HD-GYP domain-containing protein (c-di-GMP phosphodiesterase class II)